MGDTQTIDYDALARQNGAISSHPGQIDYDSLARQSGAISSVSPSTAGNAPVGSSTIDPHGSFQIPTPGLTGNATISPQQVPGTGNMSAWTPGFWDRVKGALPILDRIQAGVSGPAGTNLEALAKPAPETSDERAVAPEQVMTSSEREAHPILTGAGEFAGGMTTPQNALLTGMTMGPLPAALARPMGGIFSAQMLRGAYQEWPEFRQAVDDKRWSEVERLATHMVLGATMAAIGARQAVKGETPYERYSETGRQFAQLKRQYQSKTGIEANGVGLYNKIRETLAAHQAVLQADGARTIQDAINADKAALMNTNRGSISTSDAVAEAAKKLVDTDYSMKPAERTLFNKLGQCPRPHLGAGQAAPYSVWPCRCKCKPLKQCGRECRVYFRI
jgi:hypothetical protein